MNLKIFRFDLFSSVCGKDYSVTNHSAVSTRSNMSFFSIIQHDRTLQNRQSILQQCIYLQKQHTVPYLIKMHSKSRGLSFIYVPCSPHIRCRAEWYFSACLRWTMEHLLKMAICCAAGRFKPASPLHFQQRPIQYIQIMYLQGAILRSKYIA